MTNIQRRLPVSGLSVPDVMESAGLSRGTVYKEINSGRLNSFKVGRRRLISPAALDNWVKGREQAAA
jgi:excisionase family DNA binding protein